MARGRGSDEDVYGDSHRRQIEEQLVAHARAIDERIAELEVEIARLRGERANADDALATLRRGGAGAGAASRPRAPRAAGRRRAAAPARRSAARRVQVEESVLEAPAKAPARRSRTRKRTAAVPLEQRMQQITDAIAAKPLTVAEIAKQVGATPQRVRQILPAMVETKRVVANETSAGQGRARRVYAAA